MKMETEICVLTLNCWGIPGISKNREPRMEAIGEELATGKYDFVFLQEVWANEDYLRICYKTQEVLPHSHYFYSGVIGAGVCILSKAPIEDVFFHQWAVNGYMHKIHHGDWFGGKGIGLCQVLHKGLNINLYVTHLHAEYNKKSDEYLAHRVTQSFETSQFIRLTSRHADIVILGGDLNTLPDDIAYRVIRHNAQLEDAFLKAAKPIDATGGTYFTCGNSYTPQSSVKTNPKGERIDYIMWKAGKGTQVDALMCDTPLPDKVPNEKFSYSDHDAVVARLKIMKSENVMNPKHDLSAQAHSLIECIDICDTALKKLENDKRFYWLLSVICFMFLISIVYLDIPHGLRFLVAVGSILVTTLLCFSSFMGIIWFRLEKHGILAGKLGMDIVFNHLVQEEPSLANLNASEMHTPGNFGDYMPTDLSD